MSDFQFIKHGMLLLYNAKVLLYDEKGVNGQVSIEDVCLI